MTRRPQRAATTAPGPGSPQAAAAEQLATLAEDHAEIELLAAPSMAGLFLECRLRIDTTAFDRGPGGFDVQPYEDIIAEIGPHPLIAPRVRVEHYRWLNEPHMMHGNRLCIYLDQDREWSPLRGMSGVLDRIWDWFSEAIGGKFDPRTALHHAVGGVLHGGSTTTSMVVRHIPGPVRPSIRRIALERRTDHRLDIVGWDRPATGTELAGLAIFTTGPLPLGAGHNIVDLIGHIAEPVYRLGELPRRGFPDAAMLADRLYRAAGLVRNEPLHVLVGARNLALTGPGAYDLVSFTVEAKAVRRTLSPDRKPGTPLPRDATMTFLRIDDTRPEITTRRDDRRPVQWYTDKRIELWGCGALGSWMAEVLVRAGARELVLRDRSIVTSGLLVRQNYREVDVGQTKAEALAERLRAINDTTDIVAGDTNGYDVPTDCDLLIDATVSTTVAASIDHALKHGAHDILVAQVATDSVSSTLGIMTVVPGESGQPTSAIDTALRQRVIEDPDLEPYATFWDADDDVLFAPARGCSTPTFRGSSADAMSIASTAVTLLAPVAEARAAGGYLFALPHAPVDAPGRTWIPV